MTPHWKNPNQLEMQANRLKIATRFIKSGFHENQDVLAIFSHFCEIPVKLCCKNASIHQKSENDIGKIDT